MNNSWVNRSLGLIGGVIICTLCCLVVACAHISADQNKDKSKPVDASDPFIDFLVDQIRPPDEVLTGTVKRIVVEDYVDMFNKFTVGEFDGNSEFSSRIVTAMREGHAVFAKSDRKYALHIYIDEKQQPLYVSVKNKRFHIKGEGQYVSSVNLEQFITKLVDKSDTGKRGQPVNCSIPTANTTPPRGAEGSSGSEEINP